MVDAGGQLDGQTATIVDSVQKAMHAASTGTSSSSLSSAVLGFLGSYLKTHPARSYADYLPKLTPIITRAIGDRYKRTSIAGLAVASELAKGLSAEQADAVKELFSATSAVLSGNTADSEIRRQALQTLGDLLVFEGDVLQDEYEDAFGLISSRLAQESTQTTAVQVLGRVAGSTTCSGPDYEAFLVSSLEQTSGLFRKSHRLTRSAALETSLVLAKR